MRIRGARLVLLVCLLTAMLDTGCSAIHNTPDQDRVWAAYGACQAAGRVSNNVLITRVEPSGQYWVETRNGNAGRPELIACMPERNR